MGTKDRNVAYDLSIFEVQPVEKKEDNIISLPVEKKTYRHRINPLSMILTSTLIVIGLSVMSIIIDGQVKLTELTSKINKVGKELEESKSIYTQLEMKIESKFSLKFVDEYSKEILDMRKTSPCQVGYINLSDGDKAEINLSGNKNGIIERLTDIFSSLR